MCWYCWDLTRSYVDHMWPDVVLCGPLWVLCGHVCLIYGPIHPFVVLFYAVWFSPMWFCVGYAWLCGPMWSYAVIIMHGDHFILKLKFQDIPGHSGTFFPLFKDIYKPNFRTIPGHMGKIWKFPRHFQGHTKNTVYCKLAHSSKIKATGWPSQVLQNTGQIWSTFV